MIRQYKRWHKRWHWRWHKRFAYTQRRKQILIALSLDKNRLAAERVALICMIKKTQEMGLEVWF